MSYGRFSNDLVTSNVDLNVILAKNDCTNDKTKEKLYDISKLSFAEKILQHFQPVFRGKTNWKSPKFSVL